MTDESVDGSADDQTDDGTSQSPNAYREDHETRFGNPEESLPTIPEVSVPDVETADPTDRLPDASEVPTEVRRPFWKAVVYTNVATVAASLGVLLILFRGRWTLGFGLLAIGGLAAIRVYQTYRAFKQREDDPEPNPS